MLDKLVIEVLFGLGELAVAGVQLAFTKVSSMVSSNKSTATETQGPPELNSGQTEALNNLNTLSDTDRNATRTLLLENLDAISQERSKNSSSTSQESTGKIVC